jgi:hypothetical protein
MTTTHTPAHIPSIGSRLASCIALGGALLLASCGAVARATPAAPPRPTAAPVVNSYTDTHESQEAAWKLLHSYSYNHDSRIDSRI